MTVAPFAVYAWTSRVIVFRDLYPLVDRTVVWAADRFSCALIAADLAYRMMERAGNRYLICLAGGVLLGKEHQEFGFWGRSLVVVGRRLL